MKSIDDMAISVKIRKIEEKYCGDNDLAQGDPVVTWCDRELLEIIKYLVAEIRRLQEDWAWMANDIGHIVDDINEMKDGTE